MLGRWRWTQPRRGNGCSTRELGCSPNAASTARRCATSSGPRDRPTTPRCTTTSARATACSRPSAPGTSKRWSPSAGAEWPGKARPPTCTPALIRISRVRPPNNCRPGRPVLPADHRPAGQPRRRAERDSPATGRRRTARAARPAAGTVRARMSAELAGERIAIVVGALTASLAERAVAIDAGPRFASTTSSSSRIWSRCLRPHCSLDRIFGANHRVELEMSLACARNRYQITQERTHGSHAHILNSRSVTGARTPSSNAHGRGNKPGHRSHRRRPRRARRVLCTGTDDGHDPSGRTHQRCRRDRPQLRSLRTRRRVAEPGRAAVPGRTRTLR